MANGKKMDEVFASLGLRVRTGTACAITVIESGASPRLGSRRILDLCDPAIPAGRQPYHAVMQADGCDAQRIETELRAMVQKATQRAVSQAMDDARKDGLNIAGVGLVVGSQIDPGRIANEHIRAHAREGQLFRTALVDSIKTHGVTATVFVEREIYGQATDALRKSTEEIKRFLIALGRGTQGPWRAEEKLATLAAWMTLPICRR